MKWIRKFARTVILVFGSFTLMCVSALGQNTRGVFTLSHEVHWQNQVVPAGDYKFSARTGLDTPSAQELVHGCSPLVCALAAQ